MTERNTRSVWRLNAALTGVLLAVVVVLGNVVAERHLRARFDLSEDGLYAISDATRKIVDRIEDKVTVRLFATEDIEDGRLALRTSRVRGQLDEILGLAPESFELQLLDPSRSTEARTRASEGGFRPLSGQSSSLGSSRREAVWLSLELAYRGRTESVASPQPWKFETDFASALHALLSDTRLGIGWYGARIAPFGDTDAEAAASALFSTFRYARSLFERRGEFTELFGLEAGRPVPETVDILFVVRPGAIHERAAYEIDQFVQRGGRLIVCLDDPDYNVLNGNAAPETGEVEASVFRGMLRRWGIDVAPKHIWDRKYRSQRLLLSVEDGRLTPVARLNSPLVLSVQGDGLSKDLPPTEGVQSVQFSWAHPILPEELVKLPPGVTRTDLVTSSDNAWLEAIGFRLFMNQSSLRTQLAALQTKAASAFTIAAVFSGSFPSPWAGGKAPEPEEGEEWQFDLESGDGILPQSGENEAQIVVFGDADWLRDPWPSSNQAAAPFVLAGGGELALNLIDWLSLDEALIGLRSRRPSLRPLRDFVAEAEKSLGLELPDAFMTEAERLERAGKADEAKSIARRKQWLTMLVPALVALAVVAAFGAAWSVISRRALRP